MYNESFAILLDKIDFIHVFISSADLENRDVFLKEYTTVSESQATAFRKYALELSITPLDLRSQKFEPVHLMLKGIEELTDFCYRLASIGFPAYPTESFRHNRSYLLRFPWIGDSHKVRRKQRKSLKPFQEYWRGFQSFEIEGVWDPPLVTHIKFKVCEEWWENEGDFYKELADNKESIEQAFDARDFHKAADLVNRNLCCIVASANLKQGERF